MKKDIKIRRLKTLDGSFLMSPKNDFVFKTIFGDEKNKDILISFLSAIMKIETDKFEDLKFMNTELPREFIEDRMGILDVRVKLKDKTEIDIEIQLNYTKYMGERTLYYWSKMYTGSIKKGDTYSKLKRCVTINIVDFIILPLEQIYSKFQITEEKTGYRLTDVLEIYYLELEKLRNDKYKQYINRKDPIIQWMMFLNAETKEVLDMLSEDVPEIEKATTILEVMSQSEKQRMVYEAREAYLHDMATYLEEAEERGLEKGMKKGVEKGIEKGIVEGKRKVAKKLLLKEMSAEQVSDMTDLKMEEVLKLQKEIKK